MATQNTINSINPIDIAYNTPASKWMITDRFNISGSGFGGVSQEIDGSSLSTISDTIQRLSHLRFYIYGNATGFDVLVTPTSDGDWSDGEILEVVINFKSDALPSDTSEISGICFHRRDAGTISDFVSKTSTTGSKIIVGPDSTGSIRIITSDGTTTTDTSTSLTYTAATWIKIKLVFTKGTNVVVTIDNNASTTVTATLPVGIFQGILLKATTTASNKVYTNNGFYRFKRG